MKISIKNLGAIKQAEFALGDMTIICGSNNTGKTYATYALFGFLSLWRNTFSIQIADADIQSLLEEGTIEIDIQTYIDSVQAITDDCCKSYTRYLSKVFASSEKYFANSEFSIQLDENEIQPKPTFSRTISTAKIGLFTISKKANSLKLVVSLLLDKKDIKIPKDIIAEKISEALGDMLFSDIFPRPFIASAERTGAAIFRKELNFSKNRLLEEVSNIKTEINPFELMSKVYSDYALPVKSNVDFTRQLESLSKEESFIAKSHPDILNDFADIIGGEYIVTRNDELYYAPKGTRIKLTMDESSSAVRSLLDIGFYLRHVAQPGDLLMVDEPELNLHPDNQRRVARLFSRLLHTGIKVFMTTHSDYIVKEFNTLIMLNQDEPRLKQLAEREGYKPDELLAAAQVKVYIAEEAMVKIDGGQRKVRCNTLVAAAVDAKSGIDARSFDKTIEDMNRIQEEVVWGGAL